MSDSPRLRCPKCGGRDEKDLSAMRRGAGFVMLALGVGVLAFLAVLPYRAPLWSLVLCGVIAVLGVVAVLGAGGARYCPECDVRLEPEPTEDPPPSDEG